MNDEIRNEVRKTYGKIARQGSSCCGSGSSCCGSGIAQVISEKIGYSGDDMSSVPEGANLGLGCGNPVALASLKPGEVVLDLGSGAGFDCFLASAKVGPEGKVIGVDMTPEMLEKARGNAAKGNYRNVEFRLGEIENLPAADNSVDIVISNCVINLSVNKARVFEEAYRVLKPGGRLMVSDIVTLKALPDSIRNSLAAYVACISGALMKADYLKAVEAAGFTGVKIMDEAVFPLDCIVGDASAGVITEEIETTPGQIKEAADSIASIKVYGLKADRESPDSMRR